MVGRGGDGRDLRPELEFVFRTLVDLRVDMDDLRRDFETYRRESGLMPGSARLASFVPREIAARVVAPPHSVVADEVEEVPFVEAPQTTPRQGAPTRPGAGPEATASPSATPESGVVVYRPGMTMEDLEREAIQAALDSVAGNRRKAAEILGIGERTLYRKLARYDMAAPE
jgi:hypothetical protein